LFPPALLAALLAAVVAACGTSHTSSSAATTISPGRTPRTASRAAPASTTRPVSTLPTPWVAAAPQATPDAAAARLVGAWASGDRVTAATVATPAAAAALFAVPYPGPGLAISRGCTSEFQPIVCTYGPPGGASPTDQVFEISVTEGRRGWYVSSVRALG
jgi:hypothetical protein